MADTEGNPAHREWVQQLHEPGTRRAARMRLVQARAVGPLLACLDAINDAVVWAAVKSLGELRAAEAVEPLLGLLERGALVPDVCEALTRITGKDYGADVRRWRQWLSSVGPQRAASQLDVAACIARTADLLGAEPAGGDNSYRFKLPLPDGRSQRVGVYFGRQDAAGEDLVVVYSECGPAQAKHYEALLRRNMSIPAGAFAVRDVDGQPQFVMVDTLLAAAVTPSVLAKKIENIAAQADLVENALTKEDRR